MGGVQVVDKSSLNESGVVNKIGGWLYEYM